MNTRNTPITRALPDVPHVCKPQGEIQTRTRFRFHSSFPEFVKTIRAFGRCECGREIEVTNK